MKTWKFGAALALLCSALAGTVAAAPAKPAEAPKPQVIAPAAPTPVPGIKVVQPPPTATATVRAATATPAAPPAPTGPVGKLEAKETVFDAGIVERGADISHVFQLKNIGKGDLTVDAKPG